MDEHGPVLMGYALRMVRDPHTASDLVQETLLRLCRQPVSHQLQLRERLRPWLLTVCRNLILDAHRKRSGREQTGATLPMNTTPDEQPSPLEQLEHQDDQQHVLTLLERLPQRQREALHLKFRAGLSYRQIGEVTQQSIATVGWLIHTGLTTLREHMHINPSTGVAR